MRKIWNNPVWSNVIAAGIIYLIGICYAFIASKIENISFEEMFSRVKNYQVSLITVFYIFLLYVSLLIFIKIIKWLFWSLDRKKRILRVENESIDNNNNIILRWNVHFNNYNQPFINNLEAFCNYHQPPQRFLNNGCTQLGCRNNGFNLDRRITKNNIESDLIDLWRRL